MDLELIEGRHYSEYSEVINGLIKQGKYDAAKKLLTEIIRIIESVAICKGEGVAPWYYEKLAMVYKKMNDKDSEIQVLKQFLSQPKARGVRPRKIYEKYVRMNNGVDEDDLRKEIYSEYKKIIGLSNLKTTRCKCRNCGNEGDYIVPVGERGAQLKVFGACCPFCCFSDVIANI